MQALTALLPLHPSTYLPQVAACVTSSSSSHLVWAVLLPSRLASSSSSSTLHHLGITLPQAVKVGQYLVGGAAATGTACHTVLVCAERQQKNIQCCIHCRTHHKVYVHACSHIPPPNTHLNLVGGSMCCSRATAGSPRGAATPPAPLGLLPLPPGTTRGARGTRGAQPADKALQGAAGADTDTDAARPAASSAAHVPRAAVAAAAGSVGCCQQLAADLGLGTTAAATHRRSAVWCGLLHCSSSLLGPCGAPACWCRLGRGGTQR